MKKQFALLLAAAMLLGLTACGGGSQSTGSAGDETAENPSTETTEGKTETVELTVDNFFDYFELRTEYVVEGYSYACGQSTRYFLKKEYDSRLINSETPEIEVTLERDGSVLDDVSALFVNDGYNYICFELWAEGSPTSIREEDICTLTAVSGSLTFSDTEAEVTRPVVEEAADFEPVILADTGAVRVTLTGLTRIDAEYEDFDEIQVRIYEMQVDTLNGACITSVELRNDAGESLAWAWSTSIYNTQSNEKPSITDTIRIDAADLDAVPTDGLTVNVNVETDQPESVGSVKVTLPW